ncbi:hypothetical protein [Hansschlegelia sp.]|nr:hypothetical protein [Hansschlegelia sp.]HVI28884.1 hypothetical protein [Hansschlegelia sp.]
MKIGAVLRKEFADLGESPENADINRLLIELADRDSEPEATPPPP